MMVIQTESDAPIEIVMKRSASLRSSDSKKTRSRTKSSSYSETVNMISDVEEPLKKKKKTKEHLRDATQCSTDGDNIPGVSTIIDNKDISELRAVYKKCREVMLRIEEKYGHLLELDNKDHITKKHFVNSEHFGEETCKCKKTKQKIIFDDDGERRVFDTDLDIHVCVSRSEEQTRHYNRNYNESLIRDNVTVELDTNTDLPDNLQDLVQILRDTEIDQVYRNAIIKKIKMIKEDEINEIRFNRPSIISKLKSKSDSVLDFIGTNLLSLPGYDCV